MCKRNYSIGASALALAVAASPAAAQNENSITSTPNANNAAACDNASYVGNRCAVTQTGADHRVTARQSGTANTATVVQTGSANSSTVTQSDDRNLVALEQHGRRHYATIEQRGEGNRADVVQTAPTTWPDAVPFAGHLTLKQDSDPATGSVGNSATVQQTISGTDARPSGHMIEQVGANSARLVQSGPGHTGHIRQGELRFGVGVPTAWLGARNTALVKQNGSATMSTVDQRSGSPIFGQGSAVFDNYAEVEVSGSTSSGYDGSSSIRQQSSGNIARVYVFSNGTANLSSVTQGDSTRPSTSVSANEAFVSIAKGGNQRSILRQDGPNNYAEVVMTSALPGSVPAGGNNPAGGRPRDNYSDAAQSGGGGGSVLIVTTGAQRGAVDMGYGNSINVSQNAPAPYGARGAARTTPAATTREGVTITEWEAGQGARARGHFFQSFQYGQFGRAIINQGDSAGSGQAYADGGVARARGALFQGGALNTADLRQAGDNYAEIIQGRNNALDAQNSALVEQTDAGDSGAERQYNFASVSQNGRNGQVQVSQNTRAGFATAFQRVGTLRSKLTIAQGFAFDGASATFGNSERLTAMATQGGSDNEAVVEQAGSTSVARVDQLGSGNLIATLQDSRDARLQIEQLAGAAGVIADIKQGVGYSADYATPGVIAGGPAVGPNTARLNARMTQGGSNNGARVWQDGTDLTAAVEQSGSNPHPVGDGTESASGGAAIGNQIVLVQQGSASAATARQTANVGRSSAAGRGGTPASGDSGDAYAFPGGERSAEIAILQGGSDNNAAVLQDGLGQYARVEQGGQRNVASIDQRFGATNATAVVRQTGTDNSYYVVQTQPGQYISVEQSGSGNAATNVVQRGPAGGGNGFTPPPSP